MFVGLIGLRRGWEPDGDNGKRSITEMEHDWARDAGRPRYLWVAPDDFPVPGNTRESDELHARQLAFRKRVMGGGERIVSQKGFGSPDLLASEIVEQLMVQVVTTDLLKLILHEVAQPNQPELKEEQIPAIVAAVERLAEDKDVDLLALAKDPQGIDIADLEAKLRTRAEEHEAMSHRDGKAGAEYWRHIGTLSFLQDTQKATEAYEKAVSLDRDNPAGWSRLGDLRFRVGELSAARKSYVQLKELGERAGDLKVQSMSLLGLSWTEFAIGNLTKAEFLAQEALRLAELANWSDGMARSYNNLGSVFARKFNFLSAEKMYLRSLELAADAASKLSMATAQNNLGGIYLQRGQLERAHKMFSEALALNEELGRKSGSALGYRNLGNVLGKRGKFAQAEDMLLKALRLDQELGNVAGVAWVYTVLADLYEARDDLVLAEDMQLKALKLFKQLGYLKEISENYFFLARIYLFRGMILKVPGCWWMCLVFAVRSQWEDHMK